MGAAAVLETAAETPPTVIEGQLLFLMKSAAGNPIYHRPSNSTAIMIAVHWQR
jgi:hypothetical protein